MPLRTADDYIKSLRDGRTVYFRGQRVADVTTHPVIAVAVQHAAIDYRLAEEAEHRALCVVEDDGAEYSRYYQLPRSADDLLKRSALIELATAEGGTLVVLIKEIGSDALCGLLRVSSAIDAAQGTSYRARRPIRCFGWWTPTDSRCARRSRPTTPRGCCRAQRRG